MPVQPSGQPLSRSARLDQAITDLLREAPEIEAAAVVSFDGLPMASALPGSMDEDRVAAMSAALLSLGERAAQGLGRGELSQVYIEGESGTVFLVSAEDEAVLVAVAAPGAKVGLMLYEVRRAAADVAQALRTDRSVADDYTALPEQAEPVASYAESYGEPSDTPIAEAVAEAVPAASYAAPGADATENGWSSYAPGGSVLPGESGGWS
jgi:predicted regulator of Ras-like GTPase activity (Roadblock/LC7/MglB family)